MRVWGIEYMIKQYMIKLGDEWLPKWTGPCGIGCMSFESKLGDACEGFIGRPVFFRTRKLAREEAKKQDAIANQTRVWSRHRAIPIELSWRKVRQ